jgi:methylenetetrahydrofolate dehydrogenase (NADP+)/methenyltetrahydrofolate cyclohydrolase
MSARVIDGKALAERLRREMAVRAAALREQGVVPGLAVILVGDHAASRVYVANKVRACAQCGVQSITHDLPADLPEAELVALIGRLNADPAVDGILVQLPLPRHMDLRRVLECISVDKDVDGFHLYNVGALVVGDTVFPPCTPHGVQLLLDTTGLVVAGQHAVVVGASNIVGKPTALMLLQREATVTICHARTRNLASHTRDADILVVAAGQEGLIDATMVKPGAVVIDVGINRRADGSIVGDVLFEEVRHKAGWITPVPGGVGPMTVTMLIENTLRAAERRQAARAAPDAG